MNNYDEILDTGVKSSSAEKIQIPFMEEHLTFLTSIQDILANRDADFKSILNKFYSQEKDDYLEKDVLPKNEDSIIVKINYTVNEIKRSLSGLMNSVKGFDKII